MNVKKLHNMGMYRIKECNDLTISFSYTNYMIAPKVFTKFHIFQTTLTFL